MKSILIVGQTPDPHITSVSSSLRRMGHSVLLFDMNNPDRTGISLSYSSKSGPKGAFLRGSKEFDLSQLDAVWWRLKPPLFRSQVSEKTVVWSEFVIREWMTILQSLDSFTPKARWVNPRSSDVRSGSKPAQLLLAREVGFQIPPSLITNIPRQIVHFVRHYEEDTVYKVLTWYAEYPNRLTFTSKVGLTDIREKSESIKIAPGIFQQRIEKACEIRATTVGKKIFCARLDSQAREDTKLDWRRNSYELSYSKHTLPKQVEKCIRDMNERLGLLYAAYDFILTPGGEYCFLEVNPLGQWLWLEEKLGLPISKAIADVLAS
jgi:glutathione synthase/RimK-type ligase-like ATP-grasp enzyme